MKRRIRGICAALLGLLLLGAAIYLIRRSGQEGKEIPQDSWRVFDARNVSEGVRVKTVGENLMLHAGVRIKADSRENRDFPARSARDGNADPGGRRWSSQNDWDDNEHWLMAVFPQEVTVGVVRVCWERTNAQRYALEYSRDGREWFTALSYQTPPESTVQDMYLEEPVSARYLRLHVTDVKKQEEDLSLYYQNISILEWEAYEGIEADFLVKCPEIPAGSHRQLTDRPEELTDPVVAVSYPSVPAGYSLTFAGADYEMLIDGDGRIADTVADTTAELGFALWKDGIRRELPGMRVRVPASQTGEEPHTETMQNSLGAMQFLPGPGTRPETMRDKTSILIPRSQEESLRPTAELFARELNEQGYTAAAVVVTQEEGPRTEEGSILLTLLPDRKETDWPDGLGEEGYCLRLGGDSVGGAQICAHTTQGLRWGCVSFLTLLEEGKGTLPEATVADAPRYRVRGFGIDVGRRAVPLEFLYRIVRELSRQKMNTLQVHLNDNQILSTSDYDGTLSGAYGLYAGFRLESDQKNEDGQGITSSDLYYTKEEFAQFIKDAAVYGVSVVPEIDTPAHSLAFTKVFPELGLSGDPESADCLDLSKPEAVQFGKALWSEYLEPQDESKEAVFGDCKAVHIGMDEYFGKKEAYLSYLKELAAHVERLAPEKEIRIWGSLSDLQGEEEEIPKNLQVHIWDTGWADPEKLYEEGFSIINSLSSSLYLIPGGGYDWLDLDFLRNRWQPNVFETAERTWELPAYSDRMLGACYMMWNDHAKENGSLLSQDDLFLRFATPLPTIAKKLWG